MILAPSPPPSSFQPFPCQGWCDGHSSSWASKCWFDGCFGCANCALHRNASEYSTIPFQPFPCQGWCDGHSSSWASKCWFDGCFGCSNCALHRNSSEYSTIAQAPTADQNFKRRLNVPYAYYSTSGAAGQQPLLLDLYMPRDSAVLPHIIVHIHGGAWHSGGKELGLGEPLLGSEADVFAYTSRGFAVASMEYRLTPDHKFPAQIHDCKAAIHFIRRNASQFGVNASYIGVVGFSAGGLLAALLGTSAGASSLEGELGMDSMDSSVQAVAVMSPLVDLLQLSSQLPSIDPRLFDSGDSFVGSYLGGPVHERVEEAAASNPISYLQRQGATFPPFRIAVGAYDRNVPCQQGQMLHHALKRAGAASELYVHPTAGHHVPNQLVPILSYFERMLPSSPLVPPPSTVPPVIPPGCPPTSLAPQHPGLTPQRWSSLLSVPPPSRPPLLPAHRAPVQSLNLDSSPSLPPLQSPSSPSLPPLQTPSLPSLSPHQTPSSIPHSATSMASPASPAEASKQRPVGDDGWQALEIVLVALALGATMLSVWIIWLFACPYRQTQRVGRLIITRTKRGSKQSRRRPRVRSRPHVVGNEERTLSVETVM